MSNNYLKSVVIKVYSLIIKDDKVLILKKKKSDKINGYWTLPFKTVDVYKDFNDECKNLVKEKTNLDISDNDVLVSIIHENSYRDSIHFGVVSNNYMGDIIISEEYEKYAFVDTDLPSLNVYGESYKIIRKYNEYKRKGDNNG